MFNINSINFNMHIYNLELSYLISNLKYIDFLLLNSMFNIHTTLYSKHIVNFITLFTVVITQNMNMNCWDNCIV